MCSLGGRSSGHCTFSNGSLNHRHALWRGGGGSGGGRRHTLVTPGATSNSPTPESLLKRFQEGAEGDDSATLSAKRTKLPPRESPLPTPEPGRINELGLEFFNERDFAEMNEEPLRTARPVEEEGVVRACEVEDYIKTQFGAFYDEHKARMRMTSATAEAEIKAFEAEMHKNIKKGMDPYEDLLMDARAKIRDPKEPRPENMTAVEELMYDWHIPDFVWFDKGEGGLPVVHVAHPNGEEITIHLQGACITSWKHRDKKNALLVRPDAVFKKGQRINSGLSLAFPQYDAGILPFDGFAGNLMWEVVNAEVAPFSDDPAPSVTLRCTHTAETMKRYPHEFEFFYKITLGWYDGPNYVEDTARINEQMAAELRQIGWEVPEHLKAPPPEEKDPEPGKKRKGRKKKDDDGFDDEDTPPAVPTQLKLQFTVKNLGEKTMEFLCATKPHFRVADLCDNSALVRAVGLGGKPHLDYALTEGKPRLRSLSEDYLYFGVGGRGVHSIFMRCDVGDVFFCPGTLVHYEFINRGGFPDMIAIQPGDQPDKLRWSRYLSVLGRGRVSNSVRLEPEKEWYGETVLRFHEKYFEEPIFGYQEDLPPSTFPDNLRRQADDG